MEMCFDLFAQIERDEGGDGLVSGGYKSREAILARFLETSLQPYRVVFARDIFEYLYDGMHWEDEENVNRECMQKALELSYSKL